MKMFYKALLFEKLIFVFLYSFNKIMPKIAPGSFVRARYLPWAAAQRAAAAAAAKATASAAVAALP
jgi:hypothetical protein